MSFISKISCHGALGQSGVGGDNGRVPPGKMARVYVLGHTNLVGGKAAGLLTLDRYRNGTFDVPRTTVIDEEFCMIAPRPLANPKPIGMLPQHKMNQLFDSIKSFRWPVAIRSSSQVEDGDGSVAAGIFETKFHGTPIDTSESRWRFEEKLLEVLNSAYSGKANPYWARRGFIAIPQIPVVIQEIVGVPSADGRYFLPQTSGIINTSLNNMVRISTVLGLGVTAVGGDGLGLLHRVPRYNPTGLADLPAEGILNKSEIGCIDMRTGDIVHLRGSEAQRLFPAETLFAIQSSFPGLQVKLAEIATELEKRMNLENGTNHAFDLEWASDGRNIWLVQMRPIARHTVQKKPDNIAEKDMVLESQDVIGQGSKDFRQIVHVKSSYGDTKPETIKALRTRFPDSLIVYDTDVFHYFTSKTIDESIMPFIDAMVVIDRASAQHKNGTGLQHVALNVAEEGKILIYTDNVAFLKKIAEQARSASIIKSGAYLTDEVTVFEFERPLRIAADDEGKWGLIYVPRQLAIAAVA